MALKILITEDDIFSASLLKEILTQFGYNIIATASDGKESIEKATEFQPDLVIMDISMPGEIDGIQASTLIRQKLNIPVIYLTGNQDDNILKRALETQPSGYILKPFNKTELFTVIEMAYQQHSLKEKLRQNEQMLSLTLQSIGDGIISTNEKGQINFINEVAQNLTECNKENAILKNLTDIYRIQNDKTGEFINLILNSDFDYEHFSSLNDISLLSKKNQLIPIEHKIAPIKNESIIKGFIITFRDIANKKNARELLEKMNEKLEQMVIERTLELQEKNKQLEHEIKINTLVEKKLQNALYKEIELSEIKSRIVTTVSHEFKTPLTSIYCSSELIEKYTNTQNSSDKINRHIKLIQNSVRSLNLLINDVFFIDKIDENKIELDIKKINVKEFCLNIIEEFKLGIGQNHIIEYDLNTLPDNIDFDAKILRQILSNLLSNAIKYSKQESSVNLLVEHQNDNLKIVVSDHGIGIPEEDKKHLFQLFHRCSNVENYEGTGLGLSILKKSVELFKGEITYESELGKGSTFEINIPLVIEN